MKDYEEKEKYMNSAPVKGGEKQKVNATQPKGSVNKSRSYMPSPLGLGFGKLKSPTNIPLNLAKILYLQRTIGNSAVCRLIQAKLKVGQPGDKYERETDRVVRQIVSMTASSGPRSVESNELEDKLAQTKPLLQLQVSGDGGEIGPRIEQGIQSSRGQGQVMPEDVRLPIEHACGADFSGVKVHADAEADALSSSLNARAFTTIQTNDLLFSRMPSSQIIQRQSASNNQNIKKASPLRGNHCLTRSTSAAIVDVVASDPMCRAVIEDPVTISVFRNLRLAGGIRNLALILAGLDNTDPLLQRVSCVGISIRTAQAIYEAGTRYAATIGRPAKIPEVSHAIRASRVVHGIHHHSTRVFMTDGTDYVFDWHPTLDLRNPVLYHTSDWRTDQNGVDFRSFSGFK